MRCRATVTTSILLAALSASAEPAPSPEQKEAVRLQQRQTRWRILLDTLDRLETEDTEERIAAAREIEEESMLAALDDPPDGSAASVIDVVERLRRFAAIEPYAWIVDRVQQNGWGVDRSEFLAFLSDLARHPAPSVRATAIDHAYNYLDPEEVSSPEAVQQAIRTLWRRESSERVQVVLLEVMSTYDVDVPIPTLTKLVTGRNDDLAEAAIDYLSAVRPDGWVDTLLRQIVHGSATRYAQTLEALSQEASDPTRPEGAATILRILEPRIDRDEYREVRGAILARLQELDSSVARETIRLDLEGSDERRILTAIDLLGSSSDFDWASRVVALADSEFASVRVAALHVMRSLPWDPAFEAPIRRIVETDPEMTFVAQWIVDDEPGSASRERLSVWLSARAEESVPTVETFTSFEMPVTDPVEPTVFEPDVTHVVIAPGGLETVRCYAIPGLEGSAQTAHRVAAGEPISGEDFEDELGRWFEVDIGEDETCWVREVDTLPREIYGPPIRPAAGRTEVDVALVEAQSPVFAELEAAQVLETFDYGSTLVGSRVSADIGDRKQLELLRRARPLSRTRLADGVRQLFPEIRATYGNLDGWDDWVKRGE